MFGTEHPVVVLSVKDATVLKTRLAAQWGDGKTQWKTESVGKRQIHSLDGKRTMHCLFVDKLYLCSSNRPVLLATADRRPRESLWGSLSQGERDEVTGAAALVAGKGKQARGRVLLRAHADGASLALRVKGKQVARFLPLLGAKGKDSLLGLARGTETTVYLRGNPGALLRLGRGKMPSPKQLGIDPVRLNAALTGEVLLVEGPRGRAAAVLGSRDPKISAELAAALARSLGTLAKINVEPVIRKPSTIYRITGAKDAGGMVAKLDLGLAAGKAGLVLGSWSAVEAELAKEVPAPAAFVDTLDNAEEKAAFGPETVFAMRSYLGDPLGPLGEAVKAVLRANLGKQARLAVDGLDMGRYLLQLMHRLTLGIVRDGDDGVRLLVRLSTLHQRGQPANDEARDLWLKALAALDKGDTAAHGETVKKLAKEYPDTRYGSLQARQQPSLLNTLLTSTLMANAMPAFLQYKNKSRLSEVHRNLARIASAARVAYGMPGSDAAGRPRKPAFPKSTPWTPPIPCCKAKSEPRGVCQPVASIWNKPGWRGLHFSLPGPHRFQYRFVNKGSSFLAEAKGDLNCDGKVSRYALSGAVGADGKIAMKPTQIVEE